MLKAQIAEVMNKHGDPESFAERELKINEATLQSLPIGTKLYAQLEKSPDPAGFQVRNSYSKNEWTGCHGFATTEEAEQCGSEWRHVYTAPPELAEMQKQVQALQTENEQLKGNK